MGGVCRLFRKLTRSHMATANTTMKNSAPNTINPIIAPIMLIICILLPEGVHLHVRLLLEGATLPPFAGRLILFSICYAQSYL